MGKLNSCLNRLDVIAFKGSIQMMKLRSLPDFHVRFHSKQMNSCQGHLLNKYGYMLPEKPFIRQLIKL